MAKKIIKRVSNSTETTSVSIPSNITNVEDFYSIVRERYNATNEEKITKEEVSKVIQAFTDSFFQFASESDSDVSTCILPNIGRFKVYIRAEHEATNPKTGAKILVPAKKRVSFKAFPRFVESINK